MSVPNSSPPRFLKSIASLLASSLVIVLVWGWLLPWVSHYQSVKQRLEFLDARGIDPSAMFYTELDAMDEILDRLEGREDRSGLR
jgi:hypothetical protein